MFLLPLLLKAEALAVLLISSSRVEHSSSLKVEKLPLDPYHNPDS